MKPDIYNVKMKTFVYAGEGASPFPLPGHFINAAAILNTSWEETCSLLIMPGGKDKPYHAALQGEGCRRIRRFVENGGGYLGICAGAYFGAKNIEFDLGFPLEVCEERQLAFFPGKAVGPAFGKGTFDYDSQKGARAAKLKSGYGEFHVYYNGGCTFEGSFSTCKVLAWYADLPRSPPAIVECSIGKGKAILSGVHLEMTTDSLQANDPFLAKIIPLLAASETVRKRFWKNVCKKAAAGFMRARPKSDRRSNGNEDEKLSVQHRVHYSKANDNHP